MRCIRLSSTMITWSTNLDVPISTLIHPTICTKYNLILSMAPKSRRSMLRCIRFWVTDCIPSWIYSSTWEYKKPTHVEKFITLESSRLVDEEWYVWSEAHEEHEVEIRWYWLCPSFSHFCSLAYPASSSLFIMSNQSSASWMMSGTVCDQWRDWLHGFRSVGENWKLVTLMTHVESFV